MENNSNNPVYSVGEFSHVIKKLVETNFSYIRIEVKFHDLHFQVLVMFISHLKIQKEQLLASYGSTRCLGCRLGPKKVWK